MGAKTQANAKDSNEKRPELRCDDCDRDFLTLSALKSHTMAKHPERYKQMLSSEAETKDEKKTAFVPPTSRISKRLQQKKSIDKEVTIQSNRKTIFQCPICLKEFGVFFPAHRHIQNRHCKDKDGKPVSPDSPDLIKPIRKEICALCDKLYHGNQPCGDTSSNGSDSSMYSCLACKQVFKSVASFDEHVEENHNECVSVVILGNMNEFADWKSNLETKQRVKYLTLSNTTQKQYYQCNYVSPQNSAHVTHLCPSVIIVREFSKGIHVRYHKDHHEHSCETDEPTVNTNTTLDDNESFEYLAKSGVDIYTKLKELLKTIAQRASIVNKTKLKPLYISALEMQTYLNSLKEHEEQTPIKKESVPSDVAKSDNQSDNDNRGELDNEELKPKKVMTDDQIVKALEGTRASKRLKRKSESSAPEPKMKLPKKTETGLKENNSQIDLACNERFESPKPNIASPFSQSPSFNDTYKQFIDSTSPKVETEKTTVKRPKKEIVKTKMGQFTPSPKRALVQAKVESENAASKKKQAKDDSENVAIIKQQANDSENVASKKKKKAPVKSPSLKDMKLEDVEYEVVEQENDCNILILKI